MLLKKFSFGKHDNSRGEIKFEFAKDALSILTYYTPAHIIDLLRGIIDSWQDKKQLVQIKFNEEQGWYDMILINYPPGDILKIEIFENAPWDFFDDGNHPIPPPIFVDFTDHHSLAFVISQGVKEQGPDFFDNPDFPYPAEELEILRRMMVGGG